MDYVATSQSCREGNSVPTPGLSLLDYVVLHVRSQARYVIFAGTHGVIANMEMWHLWRCFV